MSQSLADRLPHVDPHTIVLGNRLSAARLGAQSGDETESLHWQFDATGPFTANVLFDGLLLRLDTDGLTRAIGAARWQDYIGHEQQLAWLTANDRLLQGFAELFGDVPFETIAFEERLSSTDDTTHHALSFRCNSADGGEECRGQVAISTAMAERLLARASPQARSSEATPAQVAPAPLRLYLPPLRLAHGDYAGLSLGDVIVLGHCATMLERCVLRSGTSTWHAGFGDEGLCVYPNPTLDPTSEAILVEDANAADNATDNATDGAPQGPNTEQLPVTVEFSLGTIECSLGDFAAIAPGHVFDLQAPTEGDQVDLIANGMTVGRGELVIAGETLGVRVIGWSRDGVR